MIVLFSQIHIVLVISDHKSGIQFCCTYVSEVGVIVLKSSNIHNFKYDTCKQFYSHDSQSNSLVSGLVTPGNRENKQTTGVHLCTKIKVCLFCLRPRVMVNQFQTIDCITVCPSLRTQECMTVCPSLRT